MSATTKYLKKKNEHSTFMRYVDKINNHTSISSQTVITDVKGKLGMQGNHTSGRLNQACDVRRLSRGESLNSDPKSDMALTKQV